jgi:transcriptional regulator with XRE-family HTH domain
MSETSYDKKLLDAVRPCGFSLEEIAGLARIPEPVLYRILTGLTDPDQGTQQRLATILDRRVSELFPEGE